MSFSQARFWFLRHFVHDQTAFNVTSVISVRGKLDPARLATAIEAVARRHEALRTFFFTDPDTGKHMQGVLAEDDSRLRLELDDGPIKSEAEVGPAVDEMQRHVFDLEHGELMRVRLLTLSPGRHWIIHGYHHINMDGLGYPVFWRDVDKAYRGSSLLAGPDDIGMLQYPDFTLRQRREFEAGQWDSEIQYWRERFSTVPEPYPLLSISRCTSRPPSDSNFGSHRVSVVLEARLVAQVTQLCRAFKSMPFHVYLAVFQILLFRLARGDGSSGQDDSIEELCIGVADGNRKSADVLPSLGLFLNLLSLRFSCPTQAQTLGDVLKQVRDTAHEAYANSHVPFDMLVSKLNVPRTSSHSPLFQTFLNYRQNVTLGGDFFGCQAEGELVSAGQHDYDIAIDVADSAARTEVSLEVRRDLYTVEDADTLLGAFHCLLRAFAQNPAARTEWPALYPAGDVELAIEAGRGPELPDNAPERTNTVVHLVELNVQSYGSQVALVCDDDEPGSSRSSKLTWFEMDRRVASIAQELVKRLGIGRGRRVGVFQAPGTDWICSFLGVLRSGAAYIPLDPKLGSERLSQIVKDSEPAIILVDDETACHASAATLQDGVVAINVSRLPEVVDPKHVPIRASCDDEAVISKSNQFAYNLGGEEKGSLEILQCTRPARPGRQRALSSHIQHCTTGSNAAKMCGVSDQAVKSSSSIHSTPLTCPWPRCCSVLVSAAPWSSPARPPGEIQSRSSGSSPPKTSP